MKGGDVALVALDNKVIEHDQWVALLDLLLDHIVLGLLAPRQSELVHLFPLDKDWVPIQVVESVHDAVVHPELYIESLLEPEHILPENLVLIVHSTIADYVHVPSGVLLLFTQAIEPLLLLKNVDAMAPAGSGSSTTSFIGCLRLHGLRLHDLGAGLHPSRSCLDLRWLGNWVEVVARLLHSRWAYIAS